MSFERQSSQGKVIMKTEVRKIVGGQWDDGYAMDQYSQVRWRPGVNSAKKFWEKTRTQAGDLIYRLKYSQEREAAIPIAEQLAGSILSRFGGSAPYVVPMPPSMARDWQPVTEVSRHLAKVKGFKLLQGFLGKRCDGNQMKNIDTKKAKLGFLRDSFWVDESRIPQGRHDVILVDDVCRRRATLEVACEWLRSSRHVGRIFVAVVATCGYVDDRPDWSSIPESFDLVRSDRHAADLEFALRSQGA